jgi:hypothetical protein
MFSFYSIFLFFVFRFRCLCLCEGIDGGENNITCDSSCSTKRGASAAKSDGAESLTGADDCYYYYLNCSETE